MCFAALAVDRSWSFAEAAMKTMLVQNCHSPGPSVEQSDFLPVLAVSEQHGSSSFDGFSAIQEDF